MLLDEIEPIDAGLPGGLPAARRRPGEYPIELLDAERQVGTLVVREPRLASLLAPRGLRVVLGDRSARCPRTTGT